MTTAALLSDTTTSDSTGKRRQILNGARTLFLENGYEGTSMSQVAKQANVSKGTLYNYFDCKAELFSALIQEMAQRICLNVYEHFRSTDADCGQALNRVAEAMIRMLIEPDSMMLYRIIVAEARKFPLLADLFWQHAFGMSLKTMSDWIATRAARGELKVADPELAAEQFAALCQARIVKRRRFELPVDTSDEAIRTVAHAASAGFMKIYAPD